MFIASEQGVISSSLTFISNTYRTAANNQTITFSELEDGTYTGVTLSVTDTSGNEGTMMGRGTLGAHMCIICTLHLTYPFWLKGVRNFH